MTADVSCKGRVHEVVCAATGVEILSTGGGDTQSVLISTENCTDQYRVCTDQYRVCTDQYSQCTDQYRQCTDQYSQCTAQYRQCTDQYSQCTDQYRQCTDQYRQCTSHVLTHVARMPIPHTAVGARRQSPVHVGSPPLEKLQDGHGGLLSVFFRPLSGRRGTPWVRR